VAEYTFKQFQAEYPNDAACLAKLMEINYGGTEIDCPACGAYHAKFHPMHKRRAYACQECGHHIYPAAGTIFHKSRTNLTKWFFAMYLMTSTRHGVAAKEIERQLGVTYKCAWRMCHELRKLMAAADHDFGGGPTLKGHVEIDETRVGGRRKANEPENKTIIMGMLQRDGKIVAGPVPDVSNRTLEGIINENVVPGSTISTDELPAYHGLRHAYTHETVNHSAKEYVRRVYKLKPGGFDVEKIHVNSLESHWSLFKRAVKGTHVHISAKHSWKYVSEFSYRRNMRRSHWSMFNLLVQAFALPRLQDA
jgi:transposase-like protein